MPVNASPTRWAFLSMNIISQSIILFGAIWSTIALIRYFIMMIVRYKYSYDWMTIYLSLVVSFYWSLFYLICK